MKKIVLLLLITAYILGEIMLRINTDAIPPSDFSERLPISAIQPNAKQTSITIGMVGDILLHHPLYTYENFNFAFANVKEQLMGIDFLLANQESIPSGVELGLSGYPSFNSPKNIIRDLKANGIDMLSIANNHTLDQKEYGLRLAIHNIKEYGLPYVGAYTSVEDMAEHRIVDIKGIRIGILSYTYGTNGNIIPKGKEYLVSLIERQRMEEEIKRLSPLVDVVVVSMHWGEEYNLEPSPEQKELTQILAEAGVDIIFGHHPHVLQKHDEVKETKVFYSLGNFYSAQQFDSTNIGGIAKVTISKTDFAGRHSVTVGESQFYPTAVKKDKKGRFVIVPLKDAKSAAMYDERWAESHVGVPSW